MSWSLRKDLFSSAHSEQPATEQKAQFNDVLMRLVAAQEGTYGASVTPENCMRSPTVHAIVTAISRRLSVTPVHVFKRSASKDGEKKERLPNHPVTRLLQLPNEWQSRVDFWSDATSTYVRHGRFYAYKSRGTTGPTRALLPIHPNRVTPKQDPDTYRTYFAVSEGSGNIVEYDLTKFFHARGPARDFLKGDSPVDDVAQTIALEIMAEKFGVTFFQNGAMPLVVLNFKDGTKGFKDKDQEEAFIKDFHEAFGAGNANSSMLLPAGFEKPFTIQVEHDKAQFLETRQHQRTVIAGAFGVPPNYVGDLERSHFNNVEQQSQDFVLDVILPVAQSFEAAMERDLLTDQDRRGGVVIRFNLDAILRADFKSRQEGLRIQRDAGALSANEWREVEGKNPISDKDGGNDYLRPANFVVAGEEPEEPEDETEPDNTFTDQETE